MSSRESLGMNQASIHFDWILGDKIRDGRFGSVFTALRIDTAELITVERFEFDKPFASFLTKERVASQLEHRKTYPIQQNVVSYMGYQLKDGHIFIITEYSAGGTLQDLIRRNGAIPEPLAGAIIRQLVLGVEQLQSQGFSVIFLDSKNVLMDNKGGVKVEAPLLDMSMNGRPRSTTILTIPEIILGQQDMRKADVWLLGMVAVQLLTGDYNVAKDSLVAGTVALRMERAQESAWEFLIPKDVASGLNKQALDFVRQCLTL